MKRFVFSLFLFTNLIFLSCSNKVDESNVIFKEGIVFKANQKKPFSGKTVKYYVNRQIAREIHYRNGIKNGEYEEWFSTGRTKSKSQYVDGKLEGLYCEWHPNGILLLEGFYLKNEKNGKWQTFNNDGTIQEEKYYKQGFLDSVYTKYSKSGKILLQGQFNKGVATGIWTLMDQNGEASLTYSMNGKGDDLNRQELDNFIKIFDLLPLEPVESNELAVLQTNMGKIVIEFFPDKAPKHCAYFKRCVNDGFYKGTKFHRIIKDFMIQGGAISTKDDDPNNDGLRIDIGYTIPAEFNKLHHDKGILSMARNQNPNSADSQFFICLSRSHTQHLDGLYTVFGHVVEGMDVVEKIGNTPVKNNPAYRNELSLPVEPVIIQDAYMIKNE